MTPSTKTLRTRPETRRRPERRGHLKPRRSPVDETLAAERRLRASGGPDDQARYLCACGHDFRAAVSTTVCCAQCGTRQSW